MATIANAVRDGVLHLHQLADFEKRDPIRELYVAEDFYGWVDSTEALHEILKHAGRRPTYEHIEQLLSDLRCSEHPAAGDIRRMMPNAAGVRSIHGVNCRLYGWFCAPGVLVIVTGAIESETKSPDRIRDRSKNVNDQKRDVVLRFIKTYQLEKTVLLGDISEVFPKQSKP